ncbi:MAG: glycosyltransferase family 39 protein [Bryobacteraceae bacterium]
MLPPYSVLENETNAVLPGGTAKARSSRRFWLIFPLLFLLAISLQFAAGVFHSELSGFPDEPAHYVTGLMVADYASSGFPGNPMKFAENYYLHYPKVAFGHWPPVFYILEALWTIAFGPSRISVLILMALFTALLAASLAFYVRRLSGAFAGILAGALLILTPQVQSQTGMVMVECLLTLFAFLAMASLGRYFDDARLCDAIWFGVFASLAILTKGDGWALAMTPPLVLLFTRKWFLLRRVSFWVPGLVVLICCGPWQALTLRMAHQGWTDEGLSVGFVFHAVVKLLLVQWDAAGFGFFLLAFPGSLATVAIPFARKRGVSGAYASMAALVIGVWAFHSLLPMPVEGRRIVMALPGMLVFIAPGVRWIGERFAIPKVALLSTAAAIFFLQTFAVPVKQSFGFAEAARGLLSHPELKDAAALISSERDGEGIFTAEVAMREPRPTRYILRASKLLAKVGWQGDHYQARFHSPGAVAAQLDRIPVAVLVMDTTPSPDHSEHHTQLLEMLGQHPESWRLMGAYGVGDSPVKPILMYRRVGLDGLRPGNIRVDLTSTLNRILEQ